MAAKMRSAVEILELVLQGYDPGFHERANTVSDQPCSKLMTSVHLPMCQGLYEQQFLSQGFSQSIQNRIIQ